jgi:hypothetical protein
MSLIGERCIKSEKQWGLKDSRYHLVDMIELDDGLFETSTSENEKKNLKKGRGKQK